MYPEALAYVTCPHDPEATLRLASRARWSADGEIISGRLRCPMCGTRYWINGGVADLLGPLAMPATLVQLLNDLPPTAWGYERAWRPHALTLLAGEPFAYERELPLIVGLAAPERGGLCVDVACSNGLYARALARAQGGVSGHVIGVDHALPMLKQARAYARAEGLRISFVRAKAQALPIAASAAAVLTMGGALNELGALDLALRELRRTLAPSGRCAMMSLNRAATVPGRLLQGSLRMTGVVFPTLEELNRRTTLAGLRLRAQWRYQVVVVSVLTR